LRVLYLSPLSALGGAERALLDVMAAVRESNPGWDLHLISGSQGALVSRSRALGVHSVVAKFPPSLARAGDAGAGGPAGNGVGRLALLRGLCRAGLAVSAYVKDLRCLIKRIAPDVIHANGFKMHILAAWARPAGVPILWHVHDYVSSRPVMARLLPLHSGRCAGAVANSESVATDLRLLCRDLPVDTLYNAVDLDSFSAFGFSADLDSLSGIPTVPRGLIRVGLLATMARWKGQEVFLRALSMLPMTLPVRGYIIGGALYQTDGSQYGREELRAIAERLGVLPRVGFTGFVEDPAAAIRALDIVVHASTEPEPFGLAIAEAMACGKAVISSAAGGAEEIIAVGETALSFAPGDATRLAECITTLAADPQLRARLGLAGRVVAERRFDRAHLAARLIPIYNGLVSAAA
jgi:glycosyltransferase involved in cell wall biosynthesis